MSKSAFKRVRTAIGLERSREPLPAFAWPGGYPMFYVCSDGGALCPTCANQEIALIDVAIKDGLRDGWRAIDADVNYEDAGLCCDHCGKPIPAAYVD